LAGRRHLRQYKSVVDPTAVTRAYGPHSFAYRDPALATVPVPRFAAWDDLRVNHYLTRSEEEYREKLATPDAFGEPRNVVRPQAIMRIPTVHDDAIAAYAPAVREALERRAGAAFPGTGA
jgi:alpha-ketoglutarate-dependent taurine dioxygenase